MKRKSLKEIETEFKNCIDESGFDELLYSYANDQRTGVKKIIDKMINSRKRLILEKARVEAMCSYEKEYSGYLNICGIDEAGRGPLAGPVVAGAVIFPKDCRILYINDSKKLSAKRREELFGEIRSKAMCYGVGIVQNDRIDEINILQATYEAMRAAINQLKVQPDLLLNDAVTIPNVPVRQIPIIKGDAKSLSIAAASILAKVTRDRIMEEMAHLYPEYGFERHKGYGSAKHIDAIKKYGPCPIHRRTFVKNFV